MSTRSSVKPECNEVYGEAAEYHILKAYINYYHDVNDKKNPFEDTQIWE